MKLIGIEALGRSVSSIGFGCASLGGRIGVRKGIEALERAYFWGALLWRRFMGTTVLDSGFANRAGMHVYAHCLRGVPGGVAVLVLNTDRHKAGSLNVPAAADRYTLTAASLTDKTTRSRRWQFERPPPENSHSRLEALRFLPSRSQGMERASEREQGRVADIMLAAYISCDSPA